LTTKTKFLNFVEHNCRIKDVNIASQAWDFLKSQPSTSKNTPTELKAIPVQKLSNSTTRKKSISTQESAQKHTKLQEKSLHLQLNIEQKKTQKLQQSLQNLQKKTEFREKIQDAYSIANGQIKGILEELLLFQKCIPVKEEKFKNFLWCNLNV
jgi:hypothetical protein